MTLTSPACPAGPEILRNAVTALEALEGVTKANVNDLLDAIVDRGAPIGANRVFAQLPDKVFK